MEKQQAILNACTSGKHHQTIIAEGRRIPQSVTGQGKKESFAIAVQSSARSDRAKLDSDQRAAYAQRGYVEGN